MRVYLWGIGKGFDKVIYSLNKDKVEILGIIDNNPVLFHQFYKGYEVFSVDEIDAEYDYIIITIVQYKTLLYQLSKMGISDDKIICYYDLNVWNTQQSEMFSKELWKMDILEQKIFELERRTDIRLKNIRYEIAADVTAQKYRFPIIKNRMCAVEQIVNERKSLIRFGDGEFEIMAGKNRPVFQKFDEKLSNRMRQVITTKDDRILLAIANNYGNLDEYTEEVADGIREYMTEEVRKFHYSVLDFDKVYYDAYMFKCYYPYRDKDSTLERVQLVKQIWNKRNVVIVEGEETRSGVGNDLFDNTNSLKRILCPTQDAFSQYEEILKKAIKIDKNNLVLIALGPAGKVLAYDLVQVGYQVVDVGQIDMDYEWYLAGQGIRVPIANKYVSQLPPAVVEEVHDKVYKEQIICRIGEVEKQFDK